MALLGLLLSFLFFLYLFFFFFPIPFSRGVAGPQPAGGGAVHHLNIKQLLARSGYKAG